jgi:tetratricopeptide (TPR) repeat protein
MKKRFIWLGFFCVALLIASFSLIRNYRSGMGGEEQNEQEPIRSLSTTLEEIKRMPPPGLRPSFLLCPFTDAENRITTETVAIYLPTLFKISFSPDCLVKTPFYVNVQSSAVVRGFLKPGKTITEEERNEFIGIFGCQDYITGVIQRENSIIQARITIHSLDGKTNEKTIVVEDPRENLLPNRIASRVLIELTGAPLPDESRKYLEIPSAKNPEILYRAAEVFLIYCNSSRQLKMTDFKEILDRDPEMDWFVPIYLNLLPVNAETLNLAESYSRKWRDRPRFLLLYAGHLDFAGQQGPAIMKSAEVIKKLPDSSKAYEVLARAVQANKKPSEAAPFFQRMLDLSPDDALYNQIMGAHKIQLAWEHRGSGWASTVTDEGWQNFNKFLGEAREYLMKSIAQDPKNYQAYGDMITVGMGADIPLTEIRGYFDKAVEINPDYRDAYSRMQTALMPKWGGSMPQLHSFWGELLNKDIKNHYVYTVVADGCYVIACNYSYLTEEQKGEYYQKLTENISEPNIWPWIERSCDNFFSDGFEDSQQRAVYGLYATLAGKYELAFEQFELSRMNFRGTTVFHYEQFLRTYIKAALETGHYDRGIEIARKGIEFNHCPGCNKNFKEFLDWAEKKKKTLNK